jgi:hypothetical protein
MHTIKQWPGNKKILPTQLSLSQLKIRIDAVPNGAGKRKKRCRLCKTVQSIGEFYIRDKKTGVRRTECRDCLIKNGGAKEVGALRFSKAIFKKGFRRCSVCKNIQPLDNFWKCVGRAGGIAHNCKNCSVDLNRKAQGELSNAWVRARTGSKSYNPKVLTKLRNQILKKRAQKIAPKYFVDGKGFVTQDDIARYIHKTYGVSEFTVIKRLSKGYPVEDLKLSEFDARSKYNGHYSKKTL